MRMPRTSSFSVRDILDLPKSATANGGSNGGAHNHDGITALATATANNNGATGVTPSAAAPAAVAAAAAAQATSAQAMQQQAMAAAAAAAAANYGATDLYLAQGKKNFFLSGIYFGVHIQGKEFSLNFSIFLQVLFIPTWPLSAQQEVTTIGTHKEPLQK